MIGSISPSKVIISILILLIVLAGIGLVMVKYGNSVFKTERIATYFKRTVIFIMIISLISLVGYVIVLKFAFSGWSHEPIAKGEERIVTSLGDEFLVQYVTTNFPDYQTDITIGDATARRIGNLHEENDYIKPNIKVIVSTPNVRCYQFSESLLVYKVDSSQFKAVTIGFIEDEKPETNNDLIVVSKALVETKDWRWVKACGGFLIKAGDTDAKKTLERYAAGQFTAKELEQNKNSEIKKEDMIDFAKKLLEQK